MLYYEVDGQFQKVKGFFFVKRERIGSRQQQGTKEEKWFRLMTTAAKPSLFFSSSFSEWVV